MRRLCSSTAPSPPRAHNKSCEVFRQRTSDSDIDVATKKKALARPVPKIARGLVPTTAIASGFFSPVTMGAPGDLDPTFGDMGRVIEPQFQGEAWALKPLAADESLVAGGEYCGYYCAYYDNYDDGFIGHVSSNGSLESQVAADVLKTIEVRDLALQPDGKVVAVGLGQSNANGFVVFRLDSAGALDPGFADGGVLYYAPGGAQSVLLDPDGAILVSGSSNGALTVIRLHADGSLDESFGTAGVASGPPSALSSASNLVRTAAGGYRVTTNYSDTSPQCRVLALTAAGKPDDSFGASGTTVPVPAPSAALTCDSMIQQADGALLIAGQQNGQGFTTRILASGAPDPSFAATALPLAMQEATALAVDPSGEVLVAGIPPAGASGGLVVRLQATGMLDQMFGDAGSTWIDLSSTYGVSPVVRDITVLDDGSILAAGGAIGGGPPTEPFLIRLVGSTGAAVPGVIGAGQTVQSVRRNQTATVTFRRTGGAAGAVSVAYKTADYTVGDVPTATAGQDYTAVGGQLTWADGDRSDRHISVVSRPNAGPPQLSKRFVVALSGVQGGAEIGTSDATVEITGDGYPVGQFDFQDSQLAVAQADGTFTVTVNRNYYSSGATSVTLTPVPGTARSADFATAPITLSWANGDSQPKSATIAITNNTLPEPTETFTVKLSNATNGALIGPNSVLTVTLTAKTPPPAPTPSPPLAGGGGGALDGLMLALLGMLSWLRRRVP
jgi:uncharacterized delta-60 repeat protein